MKVRLLTDTIKEPEMHFAAEEALLRLVDEDESQSTLRIRKFDPSVWIGVYQYPSEDVDVEYCKINNIPIIRRPNPGGAVYQDEGSFCFSFFFKTDELFKHLAITEPSELYIILSEVIIATVKEFGLTAEKTGVNDVSIKGRKIFGSAQLELFSAFVHSGTFLVATNIEQMSKTLQPSKLKFSDKGFTTIQDRVINLSELVPNLTIDDVIPIFVEKFAKLLKIEFSERTNEFTRKELELMNELYLKKYSTNEWTYREKPKTDITISAKAKSGIITLAVSLTNDRRISKIYISGDFLAENREQIAELEKKLEEEELENSISLINTSELPCDIKDTLIALFKELI